jgi:hypothetical protein
MLQKGSAVAAVSGSAAPTPLGVSPATGGLTSIVTVHFTADSTDDAYGGDDVVVEGPEHTECAGSMLDYDAVNGPNSDGSGSVTLYIGPRATWVYPQMAAGNASEPGNVYDIGSESGKPLARWCPGQYTGLVGMQGAPGTLQHTFAFRISANARSRLDITSARHLRSVAASPGWAYRRTVVSVRYRADGGRAGSGDVVQLVGLSHGACRGTLVRESVPRSGRHSRQVTLHIGPGATRNRRWNGPGLAYVPVSNSGLGRPLRSWCAGTYNGAIFDEQGPKFTVVARFKLHVAN